MVTWLQWFTVQKFTSVYFCVYVYVGTRPVPRAPCAKIVQVPDFPEKIICKPLFLKDFLYHYQMISYHLTPQFRNRLGENKSERVSHRWSIKPHPYFPHVWHYPSFVVLAPVSFYRAYRPCSFGYVSEFMTHLVIGFCSLVFLASFWDTNVSG